MHPKLVTASEAWQSIFVLLGFSFLALVWLGTMDCRASLAMTRKKALNDDVASLLTQ
jgi:hypothetical protein